MRRVYKDLSRPHTNCHRSRLVTVVGLYSNIGSSVTHLQLTFSFDLRVSLDPVGTLITLYCIASAVYLTPCASERRLGLGRKLHSLLHGPAAYGHSTRTGRPCSTTSAAPPGLTLPLRPPPPSRRKAGAPRCLRATHCLRLRLGLGHTKHKHPVHVGGAIPRALRRECHCTAAAATINGPCTSVRFRFLAP
jgi:hypothetical protein